jgi:RNA polymerase sigma-70 factor (ECF subfamily)
MSPQQLPKGDSRGISLAEDNTMSVLETTQVYNARTIYDDDIELVRAAKEGSINAFEELVKRHERRIFRIAQNLLRNREDAQDAVQEAFLKAFQKLHQFQQRSKFSTWLGRITINEALGKLRKAPVHWSSIDNEFHGEDDALPVEIADWAPNPEMLYTASELNGILERNLQRLKAGLRVVFLLRDVGGLSLEETAHSLGLSIAAVKARSWRARLQLREWLSPYFQNAQLFATNATPKLRIRRPPWIIPSSAAHDSTKMAPEPGNIP